MSCCHNPHHRSVPPVDPTRPPSAHFTRGINVAGGQHHAVTLFPPAVLRVLPFTSSMDYQASNPPTPMANRGQKTKASTRRSSEIIIAAFARAMRSDGSRNLEPSPTLFPDWVPCLEDIIVEYALEHRIGMTTKSNPNPSLTLVILGEDSDACFPLEQKSETRWVFRGFIPLQKDTTITTIIVQEEGVGKVGEVSLTSEEINEAKSGISGDHTITKAMTVNHSEGSSLTLTATAEAVLTEDTYAVRKAGSTSKQQPLSGKALLKRGFDLFIEAQSSGSQTDIEEAVSYLRQATTMLSSADRTDALAGLSLSLKMRYDLTKSDPDLTETINAYEESTSSMISGGEIGGRLRPALSTLASLLFHRYERLGKLEDIDRAIQAQNESITFKGNDTFEEGGSWCNLGAYLLRRFERLGEVKDIDQVVKAQERALNLMPEGSDKSWVLSSFGTALYTRFKTTGNPNDLEHALVLLQAAVTQAQPGEPLLLMMLNNLGAVLMRRFQRLGSVKDLTEAIATQRKALNAASPGYPGRYTLLNNLALSLQILFSRTLNVNYLWDAIDTLRAAVRATPAGHSTIPATLNNLSSGFALLFEATKDPARVQEAIDIQETAVDMLPEGHPSLPSFLDNLGVRYQSLFELKPELRNIDPAIDAHRGALKGSSADLSEFPVILANLGASLRLRYGLTKAAVDIEESICILETALRILPDGASREVYVDQLTRSLRSRDSVCAR